MRPPPPGRRSARRARRILLGGVPGVEPATVVILGGGVVGTNAAKMAAGLGADEVVGAYQAAHDDYNAIMAEAIADCSLVIAATARQLTATRSIRQDLEIVWPLINETAPQSCSS